MGTLVRSLLTLSKWDSIWNLGMNEFRKLKLQTFVERFLNYIIDRIFDLG